MAASPFLTVRLDELREDHIAEIEKLSKADFDIEAMLSSASDLKDLSAIRSAIERQFAEPDEPFVRWLFSQANPSGRFSPNAKSRFSELARQGLAQVVRERVNNRLRSALSDEGMEEQEAPKPVDTVDVPAPQAVANGNADTNIDTRPNGVVTTDEELQGFHIVRAIACSVVSLDRIVGRDTQSYFGVLLDDNNRKPICRLQFNAASRKYLVLFDDEKNPTKHLIERVDDLYKFSAEIRAGVSHYLDESEDDHTTEAALRMASK